MLVTIRLLRLASRPISRFIPNASLKTPKAKNRTSQVSHHHPSRRTQKPTAIDVGFSSFYQLSAHLLPLRPAPF